MRIVIGEDSALFREGLASLLIDAGHGIVGRAADAETLVAVVAETKPDLVIVDVRMPPDLTDDGARAARRIRAGQPGVAILMLSQQVETRHSLDLVSQGGFGYLLKDRVLDVDDFLESITRVASGGSVLDPEVVGRLLGQHTTRALGLATSVATTWGSRAVPPSLTRRAASRKSSTSSTRSFSR